MGSCPITLPEWRDAAQSDEMMLCQEQDLTSVPDTVWCVWQVGSCPLRVQGCCTKWRDDAVSGAGAYLSTWHCSVCVAGGILPSRSTGVLHEVMMLCREQDAVVAEMRDIDVELSQMYKSLIEIVARMSGLQRRRVQVWMCYKYNDDGHSLWDIHSPAMWKLNRLNSLELVWGEKLNLALLDICTKLYRCHEPCLWGG